MSDYAFGLIVSSCIAATFLLAGFWPRRRPRRCARPRGDCASWRRAFGTTRQDTT